MGRNFREWDN